MTDVDQISGLSLTLAQTQVSTLVQAADAIDTKASAILAFDGGLLAALIGAQASFDRWWAPTIPLMGSAIASAWVLVGRAYDLGPDPKAFYEAFGGVSTAQANVAMLAEFDAALGSNDRTVRRKGQWFLVASGLMLLSFAVGALVLRHG